MYTVGQRGPSALRGDNDSIVADDRTGNAEPTQLSCPCDITVGAPFQRQGPVAENPGTVWPTPTRPIVRESWHTHHHRDNDTSHHPKYSSPTIAEQGRPASDVIHRHAHLLERHHPGSGGRRLSTYLDPRQSPAKGEPPSVNPAARRLIRGQLPGRGKAASTGTLLVAWSVMKERKCVQRVTVKSAVHWWSPQCTTKRPSFTPVATNTAPSGRNELPPREYTAGISATSNSGSC